MVKKNLLLAGLMLMGILLVACQPETITETVEVTRVVTETVTETVIEEGETVEVEVEVTRVVVEEIVSVEADAVDTPVTLNYNWGTEPPTADPAMATDTTSIGVITSMFVGLTQLDPISGAVNPYLATDWDISEDGLEYTFHLRDDVPWVNYDPTTGETTQAVDGDGNPRFVNAHDVVYGVKRTVDPATGSPYAYVLYIVKNANLINSSDESVTLDDLGVVAVDDLTVKFTLESPAGYFPAIAGMWVANPMPQWAIEEWGDKWTEAGLIVTNGPYVMESWIHGGELNLVKNPLWVDADSVQIERIEGVMITEASTSFAMYENNELDTAGIPQADIDRVKVDPVLSEDYYTAPDTCTYYYNFVTNKYPFDDVRVRQAFSMAIDRQSLIDNVTKGGQIVASSFAPPGMFGAPAPGTVGIFYDPETAQALLQEFLDDEGMTIEEFNALNISLMHNTSEGHASIAAAIQQMWMDTLGVEIQIENQEWKVFLQTRNVSTPLAEMPHILRAGWCADYPDENNWVHEVFNAEASSNRSRRNCVDDTCTEVFTTEFDDLTTQAGISQDPAERIELYAQAEQILAMDEAAYAPIYHYTYNMVNKPWLTRNFPVSGIDFYNWTIDMDAKLAAQE